MLSPTSRGAAQVPPPAGLLELLFERLPVGAAQIDRQFRIQHANPTWLEYAGRYTDLPEARLAPGVVYFDLFPELQSDLQPRFERALSGEAVEENGLCLEVRGMTTYWDITLIPYRQGGEITGFLYLASDVTGATQQRLNLEQKAAARTQELQMLLDVSATANRSLDLSEALRLTLDRIVELVQANRAGVLLLDENTGELIPHTLRPQREVDLQDMAALIAACYQVIEAGESVYIAPDREHGLLEPGALLPVLSRSGKLGVLVIIGGEGGRFSETQLALFQSIADQLGIVIENARLVAKNEQAIIAAERNRLARDLHDAVTQTLFSSSMIADVLPKIWERNPEEGQRRLEELRQLTRGALSEMRTMLVELRPAALSDTDLGDLLKHQINAFIARSRVPVECQISCRHNPPVEVKEMAYRIAQEAFNNIVRHAEATQVWVVLDCQKNKMELRIKDDGVALICRDSASRRPGSGHYEGTGAQPQRRSLCIQSAPGNGVQLCWFGQQKKEME